jgi:hypothetical protein
LKPVRRQIRRILRCSRHHFDTTRLLKQRKRAMSFGRRCGTPPALRNLLRQDGGDGTMLKRKNRIRLLFYILSRLLGCSIDENDNVVAIEAPSTRDRRPAKPTPPSSIHDRAATQHHFGSTIDTARPQRTSYTVRRACSTT